MRSKVSIKILNWWKNRYRCIVRRHFVMHGSIWMSMKWKKLMYRWLMHILTQKWLNVFGKHLPGRNWNNGMKNLPIVIIGGWHIRLNGVKNEMNQWKIWNFHLHTVRDSGRWYLEFIMLFQRRSRFLSRLRPVSERLCPPSFRQCGQSVREWLRRSFIWRQGQSQGQ